MEFVTAKKIRLGEVAAALDVDPKLVRNWTQGNRFNMWTNGERSPNKWREFSFFDVAHLSVAQHIIRYGFTIDEAHDFAGAALIRILDYLANERTLSRMPAAALSACARGKGLVIVMLSDGQPTWQITPCEHEALWEASPARLLINLGSCVEFPFNALAEMGHDGAGEGDTDQTAEAQEDNH